MREDQREDRRYSVEFRSYYYAEPSVRGQGIVVDISIRGCRVIAEIPVETGDNFMLHLHVPLQRDPIQIDRAMVRWTQGQEFGCQFIDVKPEERDRLQTVVAGLSPP